MAADAGLYGLDFSARAVLWASEPADPRSHRPGEAWRRLFLIDLRVAMPSTRSVRRRQSVWEVDWDGDATVVGIVSDDSAADTAGIAPGSSRSIWPARTARTLYQPTWQLEGLALSPDGRRAAVVEGYSSDPGLLSGSIKIVDAR